MFRLKILLHNRNFILLLGLALGLLFGKGAQWTEQLVLPSLAFVMMLSTTRVTGSIFQSPRVLLRSVLAGFIMNYAVLGGLILILNNILILEEAFWTGFVILAAAPPAVAVIPFTIFLHGDTDLTLISTLGCYFGAFIVMPLIALVLLGNNFSYQEKLFLTMVELIIIPLMLSRLLLYTRVASRIEPIKGTMINWSFFLIVYTVVGLNREIFINQPSSLLPAAAIAISSTFLLGSLIEGIGRFFRINRKTITSLVLLGTLKNYGFAAGIALTLFDVKTAVPSTVSTIFMISYIILLGLRKRREYEMTQHP